MRSEVLARGAAIGLLAAGCLLILRAALLTPDARESMLRKQADLRALELLQEDFTRIEAARLALERLPATSPMPLREIASRILPEVSASVHLREAAPPVLGWAPRRADVSLDRVALRDLNRFLAEVQQPPARPPWRLLSGRIAASEHEQGFARVTLEWTALEKVAPDGRP